MFTLSHLLAACAITAVGTLAVAWVFARIWIDNVRSAEQLRHGEAEKRIREQYARELHDLQLSLSEEVEALRARSRRPLKSLVDSLLN